MKERGMFATDTAYAAYCAQEYAQQLLSQLRSGLRRSASVQSVGETTEVYWDSGTAQVRLVMRPDGSYAWELALNGLEARVGGGGVVSDPVQQALIDAIRDVLDT